MISQLSTLKTDSRKLFRYIYPVSGSGEAGAKEIHEIYMALQDPILVNDIMGVIESDGGMRDFTPKEKEQLSIENLMDNSKIQEESWKRANSKNGVEKTLYGKDESYPLRERVFTNEADAQAFEKTLKGQCFIRFGPTEIAIK